MLPTYEITRGENRTLQCVICHKEIEYLGVGRPQLYCEKCRKLKKKKYDKWFIERYKTLGTTEFNIHRKKDFNEEIIDIEKEYKLLGIKKDKWKK